jgi:hypothetical protein
LIGSVADHRFIAGPRELHQIVMALAATILQGTSLPDSPNFVSKIATDLMAHRGLSGVSACETALAV